LLLPKEPVPGRIRPNKEVTPILRTTDNEIPISRVKMHAFLVLYSVWTGAPSPYAKATMILIQEIKRDIVYRRYKRETTNVVVRCSRIRMLGHLLADVRKLECLWTYQGKNNTFYKEMRKTII
jgi:hypothetical protein